VRSSSGEHYVALDHIRALAMFLVFSWHFLGRDRLNIHPALFPLGLIDQGHVGVALFMTLSGYLFAKLLDGKDINYLAFLRARFMRLAPLLFVVFLLAGILNFGHWRVIDYASLLARGLVFPVWPNWGWSITVEMHFYVVLPLLLWLAGKNLRWLAVVVVLAMTFRLWLFLEQGVIRNDVYYTIIGRIDQFVLGIAAFHCRHWFAKAHRTAAVTFIAFAAFYWWFDVNGGWGYWPRHDLWIILPTIEGISFAVLIAYFDNSFKPQNSGVSWFIALAGTYSYSIYLLHGFFVKKAFSFIDQNIMDLGSIYVGMAWSLVCFVCMMPIGYLSFRFIESPFLRKRVPYVRTAAQKTVTGAVTA
jgi:peptidoglycan/LPS O-acetylase OafA/YrhL